jgi:putative transposase
LSHRQKVERIDKLNPDISLSRQAELLDISRSSLYYKPVVNQMDIKIMGRIDEIYTDYPFYGSRRIRYELKDRHDIHICRDQVRRLMRFMGLEAIYPKKNISQSHPGHKKYPYLLKGLSIVKPNQVWGTDITYVKLGQGFAYLTAILDWYSRYVIAWCLSASLTVDFCTTTLEQALNSRQPDYHNSDQGSQYTSEDYLNILRAYPDIKISMDGRGRCMDNIFTERLWRTVKYENIYLREYRDLTEAEKGLNEYFKFYNTKRRHQSLDYQTPEQIYLSK